MEIEVGMYIKSDYVGNSISCITPGKSYKIEGKFEADGDVFLTFFDDNGDNYDVGTLPRFHLGVNNYISEFELEEWKVVDNPQKEVVDTVKYQTININGKPTRLPTGDETDLNQEDIFSLIDIALDNRDEEYFNELVKRLKKV